MPFKGRVDGSPLLRAVPRAAAALGVTAVVLARPTAAHASLLSPELEDKVATGIALFVLFVVPVVLIALFWMVHILPEQIAHKRGHPQFEAIRTLCLLSLVFGGLLWPLAWILAYTKPVLHKMAYGTDVDESLAHHDDGAKVEEGNVDQLRARVAELEGKLSSNGGKA